MCKDNTIKEESESLDEVNTIGLSYMKRDFSIYDKTVCMKKD